MSDSKLYAIELGEENGPLVPMLRLVRCKECRHAYGPTDARGRRLLCDLHVFHVGPDDFRTRGEEREDEDD